MNKFEQLIEYVINDETAKARELFHDIVVEKSRTIYEEMMQDEELDEAKDEDSEDEELDEAKDEDSEDEELDEGLGGDQADDLIDDVETEEEGLNMEGDDEFADEENIEGEVEGGEDLEDRVVDLEDKLDELMAEFEALMGDEAAEAGDEEFADDDVDSVEFGDDDGMSDEEVDDDEFETESVNENVALKAAPTPVKSEEGNINKKSTVAANSGAAGMAAKPVHPTGTEAKGRPAPTAKDAIGKVGNTPAQSTQKPTPATKPQLGQAAGVNTKSVIQ